MFIKRTIRVGKTYDYRMLLSVKTLVTYIKKLTPRGTTMSVVKQLSSCITRFSCEKALLSSTQSRGQPQYVYDF